MQNKESKLQRWL